MEEDDRKKRVIEAAIKIMSEKGYTHAKITNIAEEAGVASGLIYSRKFFINKLDLLLSIVLGFWETLNHKIQTEISNDMDPVEKVKRIIDMLDDLLTKNKDSIRLSKVIHETIPITYFIKEKELHPKREQITKENRKLLRALDNTIEEGQKKGLFDDTMKPPILRQVLFGAYEFLLYGLSRKLLNPKENIGYKKDDIPKVMNMLVDKFILK